MRSSSRKAPSGHISLVSERGAPPRPKTQEEFLAGLHFIRQQYLDAIPVAAALFAYRDGVAIVEYSNKDYGRLDKGDSGQPLVERSGFREQIRDFMTGEAERHEFEWSDGPVAGRQYSVRFVRMQSLHMTGQICLMTLLDRTAERQGEKNLRLEMFNDSLTGLPNRAGFSERLEQLSASGILNDNNFAILIVDLARFSRINESIGSISGDELLITVARRLLSALRAGDVIARTGGDEFGLLIRLIDGPGDALHVARRIAEIFSRPCRLSDLEIRVDGAIGCALSEPDCDTEEVVRRAQFAVKRAKSTGKIEVYQPVVHSLARQRFSMETALRRAIEGDRMRLAFQPLIDLSSGAVAGFEALARWTDEEQGGISPADFIPVAEESGLIVPLGRWALHEAARTLAEWDRVAGTKLPIHLAVNVSAIQIARDNVASVVEEALLAQGLGGERLMLELTESAIIADPDRAARMMEGLKALNTTLAMDDFGTGYSNLAFLHQLPIDMLKIDRSFIAGMLADRDKAAIVRAILSLARALGLQTTAEGVETAELAQTLGVLGCTRAQGFYYAPPLDPDDALDYWRSSASI